MRHENLKGSPVLRVEFLWLHMKGIDYVRTVNNFELGIMHYEMWLCVENEKSQRGKAQRELNLQKSLRWKGPLIRPTHADLLPEQIFTDLSTPLRSRGLKGKGLSYLLPTNTSKILSQFWYLKSWSGKFDYTLRASFKSDLSFFIFPSKIHFYRNGKKRKTIFSDFQCADFQKVHFC